MTKEEYEETKGGTVKKKKNRLADLEAELNLEGYAIYRNPEYVNQRREDGLTKLMVAATRPDKGATKHLIAQGGNTELIDEKGDTALLMAVSKGYYYPTSELLRGHANMHHRNRKGLNALHTAIAGGQMVLVDTILAQDAAWKDHVDWSEEYNRKPALLDEPMPSGLTPLMMACQQGEVKMVEKLLTYGADVNKKKTETGETALMYAAIIGHAELVGLLLKKGNSKAAAWRGRGKNGKTAAAAAAAGADPMEQNSMGFSPLILAAHRGHADVVQRLVGLVHKDMYRYLPMLDMRDKMGFTALDHAIDERAQGTIDVLMAAGASIGRIHPKTSPGVTAKRQVSLDAIKQMRSSNTPAEGENEEEEEEEEEDGYDDAYYYEDDEDEDEYEYEDEDEDREDE
jgi:ankyrin repeat protein